MTKVSGVWKSVFVGYRAGVLVFGLLWAALIQQGLPYWDADYINVFRPALAKPLGGQLWDWLSPISTDPENWGFLDRTAQFALYRFLHDVFGYHTWPYLAMRVAALAGLGLVVFEWSLRVLPGKRRDGLAAAAAAVFLVAAPGPTAAMTWLADFAPVTEFLLALLAYQMWLTIEETPREWTWISLGDPPQRRWLGRWAMLVLFTYLSYKTKSDVKLLPAIVGLYLLLTRPKQWRLFAIPIAAMVLLAVPWGAKLPKLPPFLPGSGGSSTGWMWQPASTGRLGQFLWSAEPYDFLASFGKSPISLAGLLGPFLIGGLALFAWWTSDKWLAKLAAIENPLRFETPPQRARLFAALWFGAMLLAASALPPIPDFFRVRYTIMSFVPLSILLAWAFGLVTELSPPWLAAGFALLFATQLSVNVSRSLHYRRELGSVEIAIDKAYSYIDARYPDAELFALPDFLSFSWKEDRGSPLSHLGRVGSTAELAARPREAAKLVLSWQGSLDENVDLVEFFDGCSDTTLFDHILPCPAGAGAFLTRYIGPDATLAAADAARATNHLPDARRFYEQFTQAHPRNLGARFGLGYVEWYMKDWSAAERDNRFVETYLPNLPQAIYNRALGLAELKQYEPAIERLERLTRLDPRNYGAQWNLYWAYRNSGRKAKALATIGVMRTLFPGDAEVARLSSDQF